jgi:cytochrome bd-type quinol oxidase subunit 2
MANKLPATVSGINAASLLANPQVLRRILYVLVTTACIAATLMLVSAHDRAAARAREAATRAAWQTAPPVATLVAPEAVYSRFGIKAVANADLSWQAASAGDLRAGLHALDAAQVKLSNVKVVRNGSAFNVNAERAP